VVVAVLAGFVVDMLIRQLRPSPDRQHAYWLFGALVPLVLWTLHFATIALVWGNWWPRELVFGSIVLSTLAGFGLALFMAPPATPSHSTRLGTSRAN
jgi:NO-binding membrane sensor protein with MHYT domain